MSIIKKISLSLLSIMMAFTVFAGSATTASAADNNDDLIPIFDQFVLGIRNDGSERRELVGFNVNDPQSQYVIDVLFRNDYEDNLQIELKDTMTYTDWYGNHWLYFIDKDGYTYRTDSQDYREARLIGRASYGFNYAQTPYIDYYVAALDNALYLGSFRNYNGNTQQTNLYCLPFNVDRVTYAGGSEAGNWARYFVSDDDGNIYNVLIDFNSREVASCEFFAHTGIEENYLDRSLYFDGQYIYISAIKEVGYHYELFAVDVFTKKTHDLGSFGNGVEIWGLIIAESHELIHSADDDSPAFKWEKVNGVVKCYIKYHCHTCEEPIVYELHAKKFPGLCRAGTLYTAKVSAENSINGIEYESKYIDPYQIPIIPRPDPVKIDIPKIEERREINPDLIGDGGLIPRVELPR